MDIYIVAVERRADAARISLWIHAPNRETAKINALRLAGKSNYTVVKVDLLADLVRIELGVASKKRPRRKAGPKSPKRRTARNNAGNKKSKRQ